MAAGNVNVQLDGNLLKLDLPPSELASTTARPASISTSAPSAPLSVILMPLVSTTQVATLAPVTTVSPVTAKAVSITTNATDQE